jgi:hypothetical protein
MGCSKECINKSIEVEKVRLQYITEDIYKKQRSLTEIQMDIYGLEQRKQETMIKLDELSAEYATL